MNLQNSCILHHEAFRCCFYITQNILDFGFEHLEFCIIKHLLLKFFNHKHFVLVHSKEFLMFSRSVSAHNCYLKLMWGNIAKRATYVDFYCAPRDLSPTQAKIKIEVHNTHKLLKFTQKYTH
jgi:hypothetical protein